MNLLQVQNLIVLRVAYFLRLEAFDIKVSLLPGVLTFLDSAIYIYQSVMNSAGLLVSQLCSPGLQCFIDSRKL